MNSKGASGILVIAVLCLGLGSTMCGFDCFSAIKQIRQREVLSRDGYDTVGSVSATHAGHGDATVSYTFTVDGASYLGKAQMPNYRLILHKSDQIAIRYLPSDPTVNHPAAWEWSGLTDWIPETFALFLIVVGSVALVALVRDRKLAREGEVAEGVVTDCVRNKRSQFHIEYEFSTDNGTHAKGSCDSWDEYEAGANIWVIYVPCKPKRNYSYPLAYFDVVESD